MLVGLQTDTPILEINLVVPQKIGNRFTRRPSNTILGNIPKRIHTHRGMYSTMFKAALFVIARRWKPPRYPTKEEWI